MVKQFLLAAVIVALFSCGSDINNFDPNKSPVEGVVGGQEWQYKSANGSYNASFGHIKGIMTEDSLSDPCAIRIANKPHLFFQIPARRFNFTLPTIDGSATVMFNYDNNSQIYTASSGYIEIVEINSNYAIGSLNALFDDDNQVQGTFIVQICN